MRPQQFLINLASLDHFAQMRVLFLSEGARGPSAVAKAAHAEACKQLPLFAKDDLGDVATLKNPSEGFVSRTQLFGSTRAVLRYKCLSRVIASLACGFLKGCGVLWWPYG